MKGKGGDRIMDEFLMAYFVKKGEHLEEPPKYISDSIMQYTVAKQTTRTYRNVALLKVGKLTQETPPRAILEYKFTKNAKRKLTEEFSTIQGWIAKGWVVEEIVLASDGRTASAIHHRIGPSLESFLTDQNEQQQQSLQRYRRQLQKCAHLKPIVELQQAAQHMNELLALSIEQLTYTTQLLSNWSIEKRLRFLHFSIGFLQLANKKRQFDYKEIGAILFDEIGGSKVFDREQKEFITELERVFSIHAAHLGLMSLGKITSVYFAGELMGTYSQYQHGAIHALTDDEILKGQFKTNARMIWLVENRAVLTRMAMETPFLQNTNTLIVCLDGQIRTAHKTLIEQLITHQKVIIWTDYDFAGLTIAKHAVHLVPTSYKIIGRDHRIFVHLEAYEKWLLNELETAEHEQEQQLGGVEQWMKWIQ